MHTELDGGTRIRDGLGDGYERIDIGAYEYDPCSSTIALRPTDMYFEIIKPDTLNDA